FITTAIKVAIAAVIPSQRTQRHLPPGPRASSTGRRCGRALHALPLRAGAARRRAAHPRASRRIPFVPRRIQ
ncbi:MAG TPA: hypothetical protein VIK98_01925, partial [Limnochordales bacterium]